MCNFIPLLPSYTYLMTGCYASPTMCLLLFFLAFSYIIALQVMPHSKENYLMLNLSLPKISYY